MIDNKIFKPLVEELIALVPEGDERTAEVINNFNSRVKNVSSGIVNAFTDKRINDLAKQVNYAVNVISGNENDWKNKMLDLMFEADKISNKLDVDVDVVIDYEKIGEVVKTAIVDGLKEFYETYSVDAETPSLKKKNSKKGKKGQ